MHSQWSQNYRYMDKINMNEFVTRFSYILKILYTPIHNEKFCALTYYETYIEDHLPPQYLTIRYIWPLRPNLTTETSFEETFA